MAFAGGGMWNVGANSLNPNPLPLAPGSTPSGRAEQSTSGSYHTDPKLVGSMANQFEGLYKEAVPSYTGFMKDPVSSNIFQTQLQSLLAALAPGEQDARDQLTDRYRAAGATRSGAAGVSAARLEGDIIGRRQNAAGDLLGRTIQQMTQLLGLPISQMPQLVNAMKLNQAQSTGAAWNMNTGGGGGGGGGGSIGSGLKSGPMGSMSGPRVLGEQSSMWDPYGGSSGGWTDTGDDWNDYYNVGGDSALGPYPAESSGDDWNDYYNMGGDDYYGDYEDTSLYEWY